MNNDEVMNDDEFKNWNYDDCIFHAGFCLTKAEHVKVIFGDENAAKIWEEKAKYFFDLSVKRKTNDK